MLIWKEYWASINTFWKEYFVKQICASAFNIQQTWDFSSFLNGKFSLNFFLSLIIFLSLNLFYFSIILWAYFFLSFILSFFEAFSFFLSFFLSFFEYFSSFESPSFFYLSLSIIFSISHFLSFFLSLFIYLFISLKLFLSYYLSFFLLKTLKGIRRWSLKSYKNRNSSDASTNDKPDGVGVLNPKRSIQKEIDVLFSFLAPSVNLTLNLTSRDVFNSPCIHVLI